MAKGTLDGLIALDVMLKKVERPPANWPFQSLWMEEAKFFNRRLSNCMTLHYT